MKKEAILLIEDDPAVLEQLAGLLEDEGYETIRASTGEEGLPHLKTRRVATVITDLRLPGASGLDVVEKVRSLADDTPILVVTAHASVDTAVEAMRRGAFHYLRKPLSGEVLLAVVEKALEHAAALRDRSALRNRLSQERGLGALFGESPAMASVKEVIRKAAGTVSTVLVTGETGTGKELVADALHYESDRPGGPLIKVNCAAISETLLESELFGHEKGAFTGAERRRIGKIERADGGTLFLDEITEMGENLQAKLLRVLQGSEFERVGGDQPLRSDFRLVAATNRDPTEAIREGKLREDLFYRLNVVRIEVSPLRERPEDIPVLARRFLEKYASKHGKRIKGFSPEAMEVLRVREWPGNVRELENAVERAVVMAEEDVLQEADLSPQENAHPLDAEKRRQMGTLKLVEVERMTILRALRESEGNKTLAAKKLGIFPSSLYKKMNRLGLPKDVSAATEGGLSR